jgi:hypothetical protein
VYQGEAFIFFFLQAVAILPQLFMLQRTKEGEAFTLLWIFCVGSYRQRPNY